MHLRRERERESWRICFSSEEEGEMEDQYFISSEDEESEEEMGYDISEERQEEILSKFKPIELSCRSPPTIYDLWVLWSKDEEEEEEATTSSVVSLAIKNQIKTFLCSYVSYLKDVLIQFWAPTTTRKMVPGGRPLLTTSRQPFAFSCSDKDEEDVIRYRKHCVGYTIGEGEGVIGRVFQNQLPEFCPYKRDYGIKDHPLQDIAKSCGITHVWALPVFRPSQQSHSSCVGVLEFLCPEDSLFYMICFDGICSKLELAGLLTIDPRKIWKQIQEGINHVAEADEIKYALRQVCVAHDVSNACAWVRCKDSTSNCRYDDSKCKRQGDFVVFVPQSSAQVRYRRIRFREMLVSAIMRVGQGLIGNAFLSHKPYVCTDLTLLSICNYPMAHVARFLKYTGCITICLQNITTGNRDYVLEFFLSQDMAHSKDLNNLLSSLLITLNRYLQRFVAVIEDPGNELFVEIDKFNIDCVFESLKTCPTITNETEPGATHSEGEVMQASFPGHHLVMEELANCGGIGGDSVGLEQRGKAIAPKNNCLKKKSNIDLEDKRLQKKSNAHNQKESSCSYETLKQHFGRKLVDTAESLGVSRSTVKRWCRENNISRWPAPKRSKVTSLPSIPKQINEPIQVCLAPISSSEAPTDLAPKLAMNTMTVKATYWNGIIKFHLPFSSRRMDLMEKVIVRLKLSEGTFTVKYLDEDGDYIDILCDEDLLDCINNFRNLDQTTIKMLIEPLAKS